MSKKIHSDLSNAENRFYYRSGNLFQLSFSPQLQSRDAAILLKEYESAWVTTEKKKLKPRNIRKLELLDVQKLDSC